MSIIEHDTDARRFTTVVDGERALLDYSLSGDVMVITHTAVPQAIAGRGIAAQLMRAALAAARAGRWTVNPACSYAAAYMRRHPDRGERRHEDGMLDEALAASFPASDPPSVGNIS